MDLVAQRHIYKTVGRCSLRADVYALTQTQSRPVLVSLHGGGLVMGSKEWFNRALVDNLVQVGYAVVSIDYRLAPETKAASIVEDVHDALAWVQTRGPALFGADPTRIGVLGSSAGGYLALAAGHCPSPRPRAVVSFYGYGDVLGPWVSAPDPGYNRSPAISQEEAYRFIGSESVCTSGPERWDFYVYCRQQGAWTREMVGAPDTYEGLPVGVCPIRQLDSRYPPTFLLHGDQDRDVPCTQSLSMAAELQRYSTAHRLLVLEGYGHGFDQDMSDATVKKAMIEVMAFLQLHLEPPAVSSDRPMWKDS